MKMKDSKKKKNKGFSKISLLQNLEFMLRVQKNENDFLIYYDPIKNEIKKNKINVKLSQKTEIMTDYWRMIDERYFNDNYEKDLTKTKEKINELIKYKVVSKKSKRFSYNDDIIERTFSQSIFEISNNEEINFLNFNNFKKHYFLTNQIYGNAVKILFNKNVICKNCLKKIEFYFKNEFNYKISKNINSEKKLKNFLLGEERNLNKLLETEDLVFCEDCQTDQYISNNSKIISKLTNVFENKISHCRKRFQVITKNLQKKVNNIPSKNDFFEISWEFEQIKQYLFHHLRELEQKLLADNIYSILGSNKKKVYIEFIQFNGYYPMDFEELKSLNRFRENSLFRVHHTGLKTHQANFVYNHFLKFHIKNKKTNSSMYRKDFFEFSTISNSKKKQICNVEEKFICHHCKYVGNELFFYTCSNKLKNKDNFDFLNLPKKEEDLCELSETSERTEIFKEFFNIPNSQKILCDKKFCLDCVKKYFSTLNEKDRRNFTCPFCLVI